MLRYPLPSSVPLLRVAKRYGFTFQWYYGAYVETPWFRLYIGSRVCYGDHDGWGYVLRIP